jgi:hypothetical protein
MVFREFELKFGCPCGPGAPSFSSQEGVCAARQNWVHLGLVCISLFLGVSRTRVVRKQDTIKSKDEGFTLRKTIQGSRGCPKAH